MRYLLREFPHNPPPKKPLWPTLTCKLELPGTRPLLDNCYCDFFSKYYIYEVFQHILMLILNILLYSASCRRPIKGAAGRPIEFSDYRLEETYSSKYIPKYVASAEVQKEKTIKKHSIPLWIKFLLFFVVAIFLVFVYQSMEINQGNPFSKFLTAEGPQKTTN